MSLLKTIGLSAALGIALALSLRYLVPGIDDRLAAGVGGGVAAVLVAGKYFVT